MKITRLKRGYRIRCSDSEYAAIVHLTILGQGDYEAMEEWDNENLDPAVKRGIKTITGTGSWASEDRRDT